MTSGDFIAGAQPEAATTSAATAASTIRALSERKARDIDADGVARPATTDEPDLDGLVVPRQVHRPARHPGLSLALRCVGPLFLFALWWYASHVGWISEQVFASPGRVWSAFVELAGNGQLWANLSASLKLAFTGLAIGGSIGVALAIFTGFARLGDELLDPSLQMMRTVPFLALSPLLIVWFGIDEKPKLVLIAIATAFPLYLNVRGGVREVDRKTVEAARSFGLKGFALVREIIIPSALPSFLIGLRVALGTSLLALIFAEQINATVGIGYLMTSAGQYFQTDILVVCIVVYAIWGLLADLAVRLLERVLMPWRQTASKTVRKARS